LKGPQDEREPSEGKSGNGEDRPSPENEEATGLVPVDPDPAPTAEQLEMLKRERDELQDQLLRRRADFENYRKRVERDRHQAALDAEATLIKRLIPTLDNLERALGAGGSENSLREGVELTLRELLAALEAAGVRVQNPTGQPFDPRTHQALATEVVPGFKDGTVVEVLRKGYFFKDRLLRPALVKVAKAEGSAGAGGDPGQDEGAEALH
jgi:molecular chaperone GrpE